MCLSEKPMIYLFLNNQQYLKYYFDNKILSSKTSVL